MKSLGPAGLFSWGCQRRARIHCGGWPDSYIRGRRIWKSSGRWTALYRESADAPYELVYYGHDQTIERGKDPREPRVWRGCASRCYSKSAAGQTVASITSTERSGACNRAIIARGFANCLLRCCRAESPDPALYAARVRTEGHLIFGPASDLSVSRGSRVRLLPPDPVRGADGERGAGCSLCPIADLPSLTKHR